VVHGVGNQLGHSGVDHFIHGSLNLGTGVRGDLNGILVEESSVESVGSALAVASSDGLVSGLLVLLGPLSLEAESVGDSSGSLLGLALGLVDGTSELVVVASSSLQVVLGSRVRTVAGGLLDVGLLGKSRDQLLTNLHALVFGVDGGGVSVDDALVVTIVVLALAVAGAVVLHSEHVGNAVFGISIVVLEVTGEGILSEKRCMARGEVVAKLFSLVESGVARVGSSVRVRVDGSSLSKSEEESNGVFHGRVLLLFIKSKGVVRFKCLSYLFGDTILGNLFSQFLV